MIQDVMQSRKIILFKGMCRDGGTQIDTEIRIGVGIGIIMGKEIALGMQLELKRDSDRQCISSREDR